MEKTKALICLPLGLSVMIVGLITMLAGCAAQRPLPPGVEAKVEEESIPCGAWTSTTPDHDPDFYYFVGFGEGSPRSVALVLARADAEKRLLDGLTVRAVRLFNEAVIVSGLSPSEEDVSAFVKDGLVRLARTIYRGLVEEQRCWTKKMIQTYSGVKYRYEAAVLLKLPLKEFQQALEVSVDVLKRKMKRQGEEQARRFGEELERRLEDWIKEENL